MCPPEFQGTPVVPQFLVLQQVVIIDEPDLVSALTQSPPLRGQELDPATPDALTACWEPDPSLE